MGYRFLDDTIIQAVAEKARVSTDFVRAIERSSGSTLSRFISGMLSRGYMERIAAVHGKGYVDERIYVELLPVVLRRFAEEGDVVLVGRGGQYILQDFKDAFHILLVSDLPHRIEFMQRFYNLTDSRAKKAVKQGDARRSRLFKKLHHADYNEPHLYHLVLNMSKLPLDAAMHVVVEMVRKREST